MAVVFGAVGVGLLPWAVWLSAALKPDHLTGRWDIAWSGFDVGLALAFCGTAVAAWRRSPWVATFSAATGTLLLCDAWFDVLLESHGSEQRTAIVLALAFELPTAGLCFWIAYRTERFLAKVVEQVLHLAPAAEGPTEGDLVGVLEVAADREAAGEARHPDPPA